MVLIKARRLGHITLSTPDLPRQVDYYTHILGLRVIERSPARAVLATAQGQEAVVLEHGDASLCKRLSFQVSPQSDLGEVAKTATSRGLRAELRDAITPGIAKALLLEDPKGTSLELFADYVSAPDEGPDNGIMPLKLGHVAFTVSDVRRTVDFYTEILEFRTSDWRGEFFAFLRCGPDHHTVNFIQGEADMVHHVAFELRDWAEVQRACDFLAKKDFRLVLGPIRHIIGHNIATYHKNSDGVLIELFTELDQMKDEELGYFDPRPWHQDRPQRPKVWGPHTLTNYWGPGRLVSKDA